MIIEIGMEFKMLWDRKCS